MKVKALISFGGIITMHQDEIRDIPPGEILTDLLNSNLVKEVKVKIAKVVKEDES